MAGQLNTEQDRLGRQSHSLSTSRHPLGLTLCVYQFYTRSEAREVQDTKLESLGQIPLTLIKVSV